MKPYAENTVTFRVLLTGYASALQRFHAARLTRDAAVTFLPLFEVLNWAVALDDQAAARWSPAGEPLGRTWWTRVDGGRAVQAIRYARNRVHHQWADALTVTEGITFPFTVPFVFHEWRWRSASEFPAADRHPDRDGRAAYDEMLAGLPVRFSLDSLAGSYRSLAELLEPVLSVADSDLAPSGKRPRRLISDRDSSQDRRPQPDP